MNELIFDGSQTIIVAIIAFFIGRTLTHNIPVLDRYRIPEAVTGGLLVAFLVMLVREYFEITVTFTAGDLAMLTFFTTIGLNARLGDLKKGEPLWY